MDLHLWNQIQFSKYVNSNGSFKLTGSIFFGSDQPIYLI